ncbi:hypothetical protein V6V47_16955 [Micromonospora sp. CPCC 205539]|uniref:hypothetical protein n=1 Tax=Micromonospora sp. CPCC 205539 TaxID=3122408 RepID=UPI002FEFDA71
MRRWQRPYSLDTATGFAIFGLVGMAAFTTFVVIQYLHGRVPTIGAVFLALWLPICAAVGVRQAMLGVYVSDVGVRSRSILRTTTVPWEFVSEIHSGVATMAGMDMGRSAIIIERTDGVSVQTPVQRGDFFRPFTFRPELGRVATWPEHYDEILTTLRAHHRDAQRSRQPVPTDQPARPAAVDVPTTRRSAGVDRTPDGLTADQRRDIHALTRQHQRGALTDAEFSTALAKIQSID